MFDLDLKKKIILVCIVGIGLFLAGRFSSPSKVEIHKELDIKKEVNKQSDKQTNDIVIKKKVIKKDGTIEITETIDHSIKTETKNVVKNETKKIENKIIEYSKPNWNVRVLYEFPLNPNILTTPMIFDYKKVNIGIDRRILGNFFISSEFNLKPGIMIGAGVSF